MLFRSFTVKTFLLFSICLTQLLNAGVASNGPYYACENVVFDARSEVVEVPSEAGHVDTYSLWQPFDVEHALPSQQQEMSSDKTHKFAGTTLLFIDSCSCFLTHYFHFLEHLIGIWSFGGQDQADSVKQIVFCPAADTEIDFSWQGINQINEKLIRAVFPNAQIYTLAQVKKMESSCFHCDDLLVSSRLASYHVPQCAQLSKMLGASWKDIPRSTVQQLRANILAALHVSPHRETTDPRITYILRQPPRTLSTELENSLITAVETAAQVKINKVDFAAISFEEQLRIISNTDILIGVHGNGLSHILFLPPTAAVFELFPSTGFAWDYPLLAKICGIDYYGHYAGTWITSSEDLHCSKFFSHGNVHKPVDSVDIDSLVRLILQKMHLSQ
jgi:short coiled-coil protein